MWKKRTARAAASGSCWASFKPAALTSSIPTRSARSSHVLDEEADALGDDLARYRLDIADLRKAHAETRLGQLVINSVGGVFEQRVLLEGFLRSAMRDEFQGLLACEQRTPGRRARQISRAAAETCSSPGVGAHCRVQIARSPPLAGKAKARGLCLGRSRGFARDLGNRPRNRNLDRVARRKRRRFRRAAAGADARARPPRGADRFSFGPPPPAPSDAVVMSDDAVDRSSDKSARRHKPSRRRCRRR